MYINVVLLITFQNNLNYASTSNIREVMKFYNLGNKTFETDFTSNVTDLNFLRVDKNVLPSSSLTWIFS